MLLFLFFCLTFWFTF